MFRTSTITRLFVYKDAMIKIKAKQGKYTRVLSPLYTARGENNGAKEYATAFRGEIMWKERYVDRNMHTIEPCDNPQVPPPCAQKSSQTETLQLHLKLPWILYYRSEFGSNHQLHSRPSRTCMRSCIHRSRRSSASIRFPVKRQLPYYCILTHMWESGVFRQHNAIAHPRKY